MPSIHIDFSTSPFIALLIAAAGIAAAFFFYRYTLPAVSRPLRLTLTMLRSAALVLILLIILEPKLTLTRTWSQPPVLAVLGDDSRSMRIVDGMSSRGVIERNILRSNLLRARSVKGDQRFYSFGMRLREIPDVLNDTLALDQDATDIAEAFRGIARVKDEQHISAAVLVSDGGYNSGPNPVYEAQQLGIPVFTIAVGDSTEHKDVLVARVAYNEMVYSGVSAPVDVTIRSSGFNGERVEVELHEGSGILDRATLVLASGVREYSVPLSFTPQTPGTKKYSVSVSKLPGELTPANNVRSFHVRVLKSKLSVLIVAGAPGPDVSVLRQTLREEKNFEVSSYTQKNAGGFYEGALTPAHVDSADCIVLIDMPTVSTTETTLGLLRHAFETKSIPLFYVAGRDISPMSTGAVTASLTSFLPFTIERPVSEERLVLFLPSPSQRLNPILTGGLPEGVEAWNSFPPIYLAPYRFRPRQEAVILGNAKEQNVDTGIPLIMARSTGKQKSLAVAGYGLWRWRLMAQDSRATSDLFAKFLSSSIQWLTTPEENRAVHISTTKQIFTQNEKVDFVGQVYNANARPVDNARMTIDVTNGDQSYESSLQSLGEGRYQGSLEGLGEGEYTVRARAEEDGTTLGVDSSRFSVGALDLEYQDTRMNPDILRLLAYRTGGLFFVAESLGGLGAALDTARGFASRDMQSVLEIDLWNWRFTLIGIICLLAVEWFLRKRNGML